MAARDALDATGQFEGELKFEGLDATLEQVTHGQSEELPRHRAQSGLGRRWIDVLKK